MNTQKQFQLPTRAGKQPITGQQPPQLQFSDQSPDHIRQALKDWMFSNIPHTREHDTLISVPSSRALWLDEAITPAHQDAFMPPAGSREFCHLHQDGSIHTVLSEEAEEEILQKKWGLRHPWYNKGVKEILVYAPRDNDELRVLKQVIVQSYRYATNDFDTEIQV